LNEPRIRYRIPERPVEAEYCDPSQDGEPPTTAYDGDIAKALDLIEQAYRERVTWLMFLRVDERLASLRGNQRFEALAARMKIPAPECRH
jgi:hypothetical protein